MTAGAGPGRAVPVAEVLGPPGAGKSTVLETICWLAPGVRPVRAYQAPRHLAAYVGAAVRAAPVLVPVVAGAVRAGEDARRRANWVLRLQASPRVLHVERSRAVDAVLFDQGPAYTLVRLHPGPQDGAERFRRWWRGAAARWAGLLDVLVVLDAPEDVLAARIRGRAKAHTLRDAPAEAVRHALVEYRRRCAVVADALGSGRGAARVVRVDTSTADPLSVAVAVLAELGVGLAGTGRT